jgi:hypothetical protein
MVADERAPKLATETDPPANYDKGTWSWNYSIG